MFSEAVKLSVKRRAHFSCCLCRDKGVEVHHILPQSEGGSDLEDNGAPLCPSCHETYGANATKRKFIREARDFWYEVCADRFGGDARGLAALGAAVAEVATKADLDAAVERLLVAGAGTLNKAAAEALPQTLKDRKIAAASVQDYLRWMYPTLAHCGAERCSEWVSDLNAVGYSTIAELHEIIGPTRDVTAEVVQERRDAGENMDRWTDNMPLQIFLAVFDANYCRLRYANVYARRPDGPWVRSRSSSSV